MLDQSLAAEVEAAAVAYCVALHEGDAVTLAKIFHEQSNLYASENDALIVNPREAFLDRARTRGKMDGAPDYEILSVEMAGPEMAHVTLSVGLQPRRFLDYLNFLKIDGEWRVIAKIFRVAEGPAVSS